MSFDKAYPNRKDQRAPYRGSKSFARSCRVHGRCSWCTCNRLHQVAKATQRADDDLAETMHERTKPDDHSE